MKLPIGISDFAKLCAGGYTFIDKSLLIKDIIDDGAEVILFTRPRRFGKTLNMSMLHYYFALNENKPSTYFEKLAIWQQGADYQQHRGKYPCIYITLKDIKSNSYKQAFADINALMSNLYLTHDYLLAGDTLKQQEKNIFQTIIAEKAELTHIKNALKSLTSYLHRYHHTKPILIIDEYDHPIHAAFTNNYYDDMIDFMRQFLGGALKDNTDLHRGFITGILRVAKESVFSGVNNLRVYSVLSNRYAQYFGFLESEVESLLVKAKAGTHITHQVKDWYNGYQFENCTVYNPWSIINFIDESFKFKPYWINTSDNLLIDSLIRRSASHTQQKLESLIQQQPATAEIEEDMVFTDLDLRENALWNFLLHTGYLTVKNKTQDVAGFYYGDFIIPNKEIALLYRTLIKRWFGTAHTPSSNSIAQALINGDMDAFKKLLSKFLIESFSYFDTQGKTPEQIYHVFVLGLVANVCDYYTIRSNRESGDGCYDVVIMPKDKNRVGIIFEFKALEKGADEAALKRAAQTALAQIQDNHYLAEFEQAEIKQVLQLGLAFAGKQFVVESTKHS